MGDSLGIPDKVVSGGLVWELTQKNVHLRCRSEMTTHKI